jgi:hypothetical protein
MATVSDLGAKVKAKYPGQYDDLSDEDVGRKVRARFPGQYDDFEDAPAPPKVGMGDVQASPSSWVGSSNVPVGLLTGDEATDNQIGQNLAAHGARKAITKGDVGRTAAGIASVAAPFLIPEALAGAAVGGGFGGLATTDAETVPGMVWDAAKNAFVAATGAKALQYAGKVAEPVARWVAGKFGSAAESAAVRATNADRTAYRAAFGKPANEDKLHDVGRFLLDREIPLRSPSAMQDGLTEALASEGKKIGDLAATATKAGAKGDLEGAMLRALQHPDVAGLSKNTELQSAGKRVASFIDDQIAQHGGEVTPEVLWDVRRQLDPLSKWNKLADPPELAAAYRAVRREINAELGASIESAVPGGEWSAANSAFSKGSTAKKLADVGAERRAANRLASPSEKAAGVLGLATGAAVNPVAGVAIPVATAALNRFAMPVAARSMDAASRGISALAGSEIPVGAEAATQISPQLRAWLESLSRRSGSPVLTPAFGDDQR